MENLELDTKNFEFSKLHRTFFAFTVSFVKLKITLRGTVLFYSYALDKREKEQAKSRNIAINIDLQLKVSEIIYKTIFSLLQTIRTVCKLHF